MKILTPTDDLKISFSPHNSSFKKKKMLCWLWSTHMVHGSFNGTVPFPEFASCHSLFRMRSPFRPRKLPRVLRRVQAPIDTSPPRSTPPIADFQCLKLSRSGKGSICLSRNLKTLKEHVVEERAEAARWKGQARRDCRPWRHRRQEPRSPRTPCWR